jgi:hypothetical protein
MGYQWLRKFSLIAGDPTGNARDLSELQIQFQVVNAVTQTLKRLECRIYNPDKQTVYELENEFTRVQLSAGYQEGPFGIIFSGTICQVTHGKESAVDSFVDIVAADGDIPYNSAVINTPLAAGSKPADVQKALVGSMDGITLGYSPELSQTQLPRGKVLYGMTRDKLREFSEANGLNWNLEDGKANFVPKLGYIPGEAIVVSAATGMVGVPKQTIDGVVVRTLLNPRIRTGRLLQIDKQAIQQTRLESPVGSADTAFKYGIPSLSEDKLYIVYSLQQIGDTRGEPWYTEAICVAHNGTAPARGTFINAVVDGR